MVLAAGREDCLRPRGKTSSGGRNDSQNARQEFAAEKVYPFPVVVTESHAFATIALDFHRQAWNRQRRVIAGPHLIGKSLNIVLHASMLEQNPFATYGVLPGHCAWRELTFWC
jgi:hypothetical protein